MAKISRYKFIKKLYPNTLVLFYDKGKYSSLATDQFILNFIQFTSLYSLEKRKINYLVVQNMNILERKKFLDNKYSFYYSEVRLLNILERIKERLMG